MLIGCLGGWCQSREKCAHHEIFPVDRFVERLCGKEEEPTVIKEYEDTKACGSNRTSPVSEMETS